MVAVVMTFWINGNQRLNEGRIKIFNFFRVTLQYGRRKRVSDKRDPRVYIIDFWQISAFYRNFLCRKILSAWKRLHLVGAKQLDFAPHPSPGKCSNFDKWFNREWSRSLNPESFKTWEKTEEDLRGVQSSTFERCYITG